MRTATTSIFLIVIYTAISLFAFSYGQEKDQAEADKMWIHGKAIWPGHDLSRASVEVYRDQKFTEPYTSGLLLNKEGIYSLAINEPGEYYIVVFVDDNDNGKFDTGDGMGIYGVTEWTDARQKPKPVVLTTGDRLSDIDIHITSTVGAPGRMIPLSLSQSDIVTGISGKLIWPDHKFPNSILFVYSDPSWNNRIAQTDVRENGEYEISLPAGRYYLLAVIDENNTNLLDVGDKFGIWGMTRFDVFPKAVEVTEGQVVRNRNILIIGRIGISGRPVPLKETETEKKEQAKILEGKIILRGQVFWPDHDLRFGIVQAYSDPSMAVAAAQAKTDENGRFQLLLPAGDYYIMASVDANGDGKYSSGDGIGAYATKNAAEQMPEKLTISDSQNEEIAILITAEFGSSGQLKPLPEQEQQQIASIESPGNGISGEIKWEGREISSVILIFSENPRFEGGSKVNLQLDEDGRYTCSTPPGDYYIMAIADLNDNEQIDVGDGRGFYGRGYRGTPQQVTVLADRISSLINIEITELLNPNGRAEPIKTPGSLRFWYGEPGNIYKNKEDGRDMQEWWYWSRGLTFIFEETESGLNLIDTNEFTPVDPDQPPKRVTERSESASQDYSGTLYYTFDRIIWAADADGTNRRWLVTGTQPTASIDGGRLLFLDTNGNIYLIHPEDESSAQIIVSRRETGFHPTISHNGRAVAFTRSDGVNKGIILKNIETDEESAIPLASMDLYHPAWSSDDKMIAYSAAPLSAEPQSLKRDIYYYNLSTNQTQRMTSDERDEFEPAWSPVNRQMLAYCKSEGEHSQIWLATFDKSGQVVERQLTRYGGSNPAWSPDGSRIVYQNNAQLWTVKSDGSEEAPIIVDDKPVFGFDPFWTQ